MFNAAGEHTSRDAIRVELDATAGLTTDLVGDLELGLNRAEDAGPGTVLFIRIRGARSRVRLGPWPGSASIQLVTKWERTLRRLECASSGSVAYAEHACSTSALEVLLAADYRLASEDFVVDMVGAGGQLWPGMVIYRLVQQLGIARSRKLALFQRHLSAAQALSLGILDALTTDVSTSLAELAPLLEAKTNGERAVRRRLMLDAQLTTFDDALGSHLAACDRTLRREGESLQAGAESGRQPRTATTDDASSN